MITIDLNADLGEGFGAWRMGDDVAMLDIVTSANIACGFHAGDATIMRTVCEAAVQRNVAIGAHVSYHDLAGFGRRDMQIDAAELADQLRYQIGALDAIARAAGGAVQYVKAHGALYNRCAQDAEHAGALVAATASAASSPLVLLAAPGSTAAALATDAGLRCVLEGFCDRAYRDDATLVPRGEPGAVFATTEECLRQALSLVCDGEARTLRGAPVAVRAASLCVHGDSPHAVDVARAVRSALRAARVHLQSFVGS